MTIYEKMKAAGVEIAHHESDLYVPVNDVTTAIVKDYEFASIVTKFFDNITHTLWYDIPFAYHREEK
jgi:hypothetical protein